MAITRAWLFLVALSALSTAISVSGKAGPLVALAILLLAWFKARIILRRYLGLAEAPAWGRGFDMVLGGHMLLAMTLVVMAG